MNDIRPTTTTDDDRNLEGLVRAALAHHATLAPTTLRAGLPQHAAARPRTRWLLPAAAAVVAIGIPLGWVVAHRAPGNAPGTPPAGTTAASSPATPGRHLDTSTWRIESYAGVEVRVPPEWGWGGAPTDPTGDGALFDCGATRAFVGPRDLTYESVADIPFVGRPVMMSDACGGDPAIHPTVDAVWLGAASDDGTEAYADGQVRETRTVDGVTVTVFARDADLRTTILDSARSVEVDGNGCPRTIPDQHRDSTWTADDTPTAVSICLYGRPDNPQDQSLLWSGRVGADRAARYAAAAGPGAKGAHAVTTVDWTAEIDRIYLALTGPGDIGSAPVRWDRYSATRGVLSPDGAGSVLTPPTLADTAPWAEGSGGVKAYAVGGFVADPALSRFFRGLLG